MEIDTNTHIIQLVQSKPVLYSKCSDFHGRNHHWKEIAEILREEESWVKSRWHLLRTKFLMEYSAQLKGKPPTFKYFHEMSFLIEHINIHTFDMHTRQDNSRTQPEFVILKGDLETESDDDSTNIFVELDLEDGTNKGVIKLPQRLSISEENIEDELDETVYVSQNDYSQNIQMNKTSNYKFNQAAETFQLVEVKEENNSAAVALKEIANSQPEKNDETKTTCSESENSSESKQAQQLSSEILTIANENAETSTTCDNNSEKHRCEDTIFGELVAATLRKMPNDKKKTAKREIMNILFT